MQNQDTDTYLRRGRNIFLQKSFEEIANLADKNNIKLIALKGIAYLYELYEDPAQRDLGDIDILVHYSDIPRMIKILQSQGYALENDKFNAKKPYSDYLNSVVLRKKSKFPYFIHLHWHLRNTSLPLSFFNIDMDEIILKAKKNKSKSCLFYTLCPEHNFIYMAFHGFVHSFDRPSLLDDMRLYYKLNLDEINHQRLISIARTWNLGACLYSALSLMGLEELHSLSAQVYEDLSPETKKACKIFCRSLNTGSSQNLVMPIYFSLQKNLWQKFVFICKTQFPGLKTMERIYSKKGLKNVIPYYGQRIRNSFMQIKAIAIKRINLSSYAQWLPLFSAHKKEMVLIFVFSVMALIFTLLIPFMVKSIVEGFLRDQASSQIIQSSIIASILYIVALGFQSLASYKRRVLRLRLRNKITQKQFVKYLSDNLECSQKDTSGSKAYELIQDCERVADSLISLFNDGFLCVLKAVLVFALLFYFDSVSAILAIVIFFVLNTLSRKLSVKIKDSYSQILDKEQKISSFLNELFDNIFLVKSFRTEREENQRYQRLTGDYAKSYEANIYLDTLHGLFGSSAGRLAMIALLLLSLYRIQLGYLNAADFSAAFVYLVQLALMQSTLIVLLHKLSLGNLACSRLVGADLCVGPIFSDSQARADTQDRPYGICIENISFSYADKTIFKNYNCEILEGWTAIVGPSGSGKSTLLKLILGLLAPEDGIIQLPKAGQTHGSAPTRIVGQDPLLWNDTVMNNIAYGSVGISADEVFKAAKLATAGEFIKGFVNGYSAIIDPEASNLSEGQKQKLCLARALISKPSILLIDEAFSSLDEVSERNIIENLKALPWLKYVIVVSHRRSTISQCDCKIVLG